MDRNHPWVPKKCEGSPIDRGGGDSTHDSVIAIVVLNKQHSCWFESNPITPKLRPNNISRWTLRWLSRESETGRGFHNAVTVGH